ncbi:phage tail protein [Bradyrhizobium sp. PRIMUS42]|uniref:phage tail protein n=1 Tax=Bradyrhizobium sp. PRIMUS42 TaxID=2908926 RepID=UPI001FF3C441|nr:tail fiber protein [Bradyrhizobium sp. PRIMUS42]MCJ9732794.1 phage tail protein [Bradyrhizobium sp. PRIMUS42]
MSSTPYNRQTSFALFSAENPSAQQPGNALDAEFNAVKVAIDDTQQNLSKIQDADGALKRGSVGKEQFDSSVSLGFAAPSRWAIGVRYAANISTVFHDSIFFIANTDHVSGPSFDPGKWDEIADFTAAAAIPDGSITSVKLAAGAVAGDKLADGVVANSKLATGAVTTNKVADQGITSPKIADAAVGITKLGPDANQIIPAASIMPFAGTSVPDGWLLCYGQSVLRSDYPALFAAIGTTYGSVDGTHFTLPDLRGRVAAGADAMGGSAAGRLTNSFFANPTTLGSPGGSESRVLATPNLPPYTPAGTIAGSISSSPYGIQIGNGTAHGSLATGGDASYPKTNEQTLSFSASGLMFSGTPQGGTSNSFGIIQPTLILNYIIKAH